MIECSCQVDPGRVAADNPIVSVFGVLCSEKTAEQHNGKQEQSIIIMLNDVLLGLVRVAADICLEDRMGCMLMSDTCRRWVARETQYTTQSCETTAAHHHHVYLP